MQFSYRHQLCVLNARLTHARRTVCRQCLHTSAYVIIRQHTSAYVSSIRQQHTSAYVSIRQHASACVSIRQHMHHACVWNILLPTPDACLLQCQYQIKSLLPLSLSLSHSLSVSLSLMHVRSSVPISNTPQCRYEILSLSLSLSLSLRCKCPPQCTEDVLLKSISMH